METMRHNRAEVIRRATHEFKLLDRLVSGLTPAEWRKPVPRPETKERWTVKDALAHVTYFKADVIRAARGERWPPELSGLNITEQNHLIFMRYHKRPPREILEWHRQVQADLLEALRDMPDEWFSGRERKAEWPYDLDGHSAYHRIRDIEGALANRKA